MSKIRRRIAGVLAVAPVLGLGVAALPATDANASAAPLTCQLTISHYKTYSNGSRYYKLSVRTASRYPHVVIQRYAAYGSDDGPDQFLFSWPASRSIAIVRSSVLNEDNGFFNKGDEVYVRCTFYNQHTGSRYGVDSNIVKGHF